MSVSFFITAVDPIIWKNPQDTIEKPISTLKVDLADFGKQLQERWPTSKVYLSDLADMDTNVALWCILPAPSELVGDFGGQRFNLFRDLQSLSLEGGGYDDGFQGFVLWYRAYIPEAYRLWFFCSSSWERLELKTDMTEEDIANFRKTHRI